MFKGLCIVNVFSSITNKMQRYTIHLLMQDALHVSGSSSTHHQELKIHTYSIWYLLSRYCYCSRKELNFCSLLPSEIGLKILCIGEVIS
jgi:hypothetical protein